MDQQGEKAPSGEKAGAEQQPQRCMTGPEKTTSDTTEAAEADNYVRQDAGGAILAGGTG